MLNLRCIQTVLRVNIRYSKLLDGDEDMKKLRKAEIEYVTGGNLQKCVCIGAKGWEPHYSTYFAYERDDLCGDFCCDKHKQKGWQFGKNIGKHTKICSLRADEKVEG